MIANTSYLNNSTLEFEDISKELVVGSCGHYRFSGKDRYHTRRPAGRVDYQLLYLVSGKAAFWIGDRDVTVTAGQMVLYKPHKKQDYIYLGQDRPEVFWVHFTGAQAEQILTGYGIKEGVLHSGNDPEYARLFQKMISELKTCSKGFEELLAMYLRQIFILLYRSSDPDRLSADPKLREEMEKAIEYFHEHYMEPISIEQYAKSRSMSVSWFLRCFKQYTKHSPMQYITAVRLNNAVNLLENTGCNIAQVAAMTGYENPLYFSRIFRKIKGLSPSQYRKTLHR
jgi:AraC-like DNA-binding protein